MFLNTTNPGKGLLVILKHFQVRVAHGTVFVNYIKSKDLQAHKIIDNNVWEKFIVPENYSNGKN